MVPLCPPWWAFYLQILVWYLAAMHRRSMTLSTSSSCRLRFPCCSSQQISGATPLSCQLSLQDSSSERSHCAICSMPASRWRIALPSSLL